ncbi:type IV secretion system DNA-binding domain-containing protein [Hyphococcus sp.]|uniref:type IV secretion system DNA-binding domain-containing protein n=1 Tax=Hyphococcus sp. TaxID=2038636 RepID=UPI003D0FFA5A
MNSPKKILIVASIVLFLAAFAVFDVGFRQWTPIAHMPDGGFARYRPADMTACAKYRVRAFFFDAYAKYFWSGCRAQLIKTNGLAGFNLRYWPVVSLSVAGTGALLAFALTVRWEPPRVKVTRGREYLTGGAARARLRSACAVEYRYSSKGLQFPPGIRISAERETRHWLIWGSVGSGKTQTMLHLMRAAIWRGDKILVLDTKGDMTESMPTEPAIVAPQDERSFVWDVAADCRTKQDARELAARFIPASSDPFWSDAAREIFVACIAQLQAEKPEQWSWADLRDIVLQDSAALFKTAQTYHPEAMRVLKDPASKTAQSVLTTFQAHLNVVSALAESWGGHENPPRFSVNEWLHMDHAKPVILQRDAKYPELSNAWISGLLGLLSSAVGSPSLSESRTRRVWLFLDEFPQLPRMSDFSTFLDMGRSKGVIVVMGAQDIAQIRSVYGRERADSWIGMIGTQVITRLNFGRGAEEASLMIGDQDVEYKVRSTGTSGAHTTVTESIHRETRRVVTAADLSNRLGPRKKRIRIALLGPGKDAYELDLPYVRQQQLRPASQPAQWTYRATERARYGKPGVKTEPESAISKADAAFIRGDKDD